MPAHTFLRSRMIVGAALLALAPGCGAQYAPSDAAIGASSGGGAAYFPAAPAASASDLAASRQEPPAPAQAAVPGDGRGITITAASGSEVIALTEPPTHGTVAISGSGAAPSLRYTPVPGYLGRDQFSISLANGRRTVTVSVITKSP